MERMNDRENVIQHFEDCIRIADCQTNHHWVFIRAEILRDALALLKAQEPRECENTGKARIFCCSVCGYEVDDIFINERRFEYPSINFCSNCGRVVKRE